MLEVPPAERDADMLQSYARIGIGPGLDVDGQDANTKRGLARGAVDGRKIIAEAFAAGYGQHPVNGWNYPPAATGRLTPTRDWLMRSVQLLAGFVVNDPIEATYLNVSVDGEGKPLSGKNRYIIRFEKGGQPKVNAFWSVTMSKFAIQSCHKSDQPLFARRPQRNESGQRWRRHDVHTEGLTGAGQRVELATRSRRKFLPRPSHLFPGKRHRQSDVATTSLDPLG